MANVDLNDPQYQLEGISDPIEKFNMFIRKWCPDYAHLIDTDDNDGQQIRDMIKNFQDQEDQYVQEIDGLQAELNTAIEDLEAERESNG